MASKSAGPGKINMKTNAKLADIHLASKSLADAADYSKVGYPAHDSLHINTKVPKSARIKGED